MRRRRRWYVALLLAVALGAGGCGTGSPTSPPTGIDQLVIPTPSPDPADFARRVDNPWLPLAPGARRRYQVAGGASGTRTVTVSGDPVDVAGVSTTAVETTEADGTVVIDYFAQDRRGNVWWFGREGEWRAGEDGAEAGLAMPADPRLGDGWRVGFRPDLLDVRAVVVSLDQTVTTPAGRYDDVVTLEISNPLEPGGGDVRTSYARDVGLVEAVSTDGTSDLTALESGPG